MSEEYELFRLLEVFEDPFTAPHEDWMCDRELGKPPCVVT